MLLGNIYDEAVAHLKRKPMKLIVIYENVRDDKEERDREQTSEQEKSSSRAMFSTSFCPISEYVKQPNIRRGTRR